MPQPLSINKWQDAIADSPHLGFALMRNVDIESFTGAVRTGKKPVTKFHAAYSQTFTADAGTNICTAAGGSLAQTGTAVQFTTTGTLPAGLTTNTTYFINRLSSTTFEVCTTIANANAGTEINITDAGTGTHTVTTVDPATIRHYANDPRTNTVYCQDSNGRVWYEASSVFLLLNGNTLTGAAGNGLIILVNSDTTATYLFAFRNAAIDVVNVFGTTQKETPSWSNSWQTLVSGAGSGNSHFALRGQDGIIYYTDDRYIGSIRERTVFDPANGATYTWTQQALDLPNGTTSYWLAELGTNLLITASNSDKIYPWNRIDDSFGMPIPLPEYGGNKMINIGNIVYVLAGTKGNIYQTQGTYTRLFKTIPAYLVNNAGSIQSNEITWGGLASRNGALLVGIGTLTSGNSGAYVVLPDGRLFQENMPSTGSAVVTAFYAINDLYQMGYAGGADYFDGNYYAAYEAVVQSGLYRVATKTEKGAFSEIELQIAKPVAGHVRIKYRTDLNSAFSDFPSGAVAFTTSTAATSYNADIGLTNLENVQIQIEFDGNIEIMEATLIP